VRKVLYVAHPVRPTETEFASAEQSISSLPTMTVAINRNIKKAMAWLSWLRCSFPETTFIAPWIASTMAGADDSDPQQREAGMADNFAVIERCDGIVLCGPRISEGMDREIRHGTHRVIGGCSWFSLAPTMGDVPEFEVYDLTKLATVPTGISAPNLAMLDGRPPFRDWYDCAITPIVYVQEAP
jgi:hypothetical protein